MLRPKYVLLALWLLLPLAALGCSTMNEPAGGSDGGAVHQDMVGSPGDALPATGRAFAEACDTNSQCTSMLCTKDSYDRLTAPICTYKCDPAAPSSPQCPMGCNMKGYCRIPK